MTHFNAPDVASGFSRRWLDAAPAGARLTRRAILAGLGALAAAGPAAASQPDDLSGEMILNDPAAPVGGNPRGDVTIVSFFDYNCPFCKRTVAPLTKVMKADGRIRLVYKDWPILTQSSVYGAKLALAAKYQGGYEKAYHALMAIDGGRVPEARMREALIAAGFDMGRLERDAKAKNDEITTLLRRNNAQAEGLGLQGTPVFLVGPFLVASALDEAGFRQVISDARDAQKG
ncbi:MAG: DsbA family protein [Aquamicrobium sp.]|uniref:DsbA family protein n=1 Tax=Aquamicrobium sp. TaxID=1872579 RepID=UPI00349EA918|nr:DsbA family protein [Aquamicrobium sp.]